MIQQLVQSKATPEQVIDTLYARTFTRKPTPEEVAGLKQTIEATPEAERKNVYDDIFWALMNSQEFMFNH